MKMTRYENEDRRSDEVRDDTVERALCELSRCCMGCQENQLWIFDIQSQCLPQLTSGFHESESLTHGT